METQNITQMDGEKICFSYVRFSSAKQAKGDSERRQLEIAPRVAKEKGWTLRDDLSAKSEAKSAYKGSNVEAIEAIIQAAQSGKIPVGSVCILEALDRLTRLTLDEAYQLFRRVILAGVEIYTDKSGRHMTKADLNNPMSLMMTVVELNAAFEYSDKLADRVSKAWKQKKSRASDGVIVSKMAPAWLDVDRTRNEFSINGNAITVKRIFNDYANGKGIRTIMRDLNAEKVTPFGKGNQNKDKCWSSTHIRRLLSFRGVLGEYEPKKKVGGKNIRDGEPIANYYPQIIEKPLFYKVEKLLARAKSKPASGPKSNVTNLFTGLVKCACCGGSMVIKQSGLHYGKYAYTSLVCYNAMRGNGCRYHTIQYSYVERAVLTLLFSKVIPAMSATDTRQEKLTTLYGDLAAAQKQKAIWVEIIETGKVPSETAAQKLNALETKEKALKRQIEIASASINDNPLGAWQHLENNPANRLRLQTLLSDEIECLTIDAGNRTAKLAVKDPECSFEIRWPQSKGANANKENPADFGFTCEGFEKPFAYLDQHLVWKSSQNWKTDKLLGIITTEDEAVIPADVFHG